jgi:hypothetical protein
MRWAVLALIGCAATLPPQRAPEFATPEPPDLIDASTFTTRVASLRATLARSKVALDTAPVISSCGVHHGIDDCLRCELAGRTDTSGVDPDLIDAVAIAFAHYPTAVLRAAHLDHVALCRRIAYDHSHDEPDPAGVAIYGDQRLMISLALFSATAHERYGSFSIEQVVHHELFHMLDRATQGAAVEDDRAWHALNPPRFVYADSRHRAPALLTASRPAGFVDAYSTTNELEDRASVYEYMMGQPEALCALARVDPIVAAKAKLVRSRVAAIVGDSRLPHCDRPPPKPVPVLHERPPSIVGKMR